ncbi:pili assembly chaperone [Seongchinamella unica]|uniref:Pili assembly chaperone n=1 Tax=Seongchinamella unica TaxID=2547392 RepID=A0A4R5LUC0_9GAMM|nr:pili assembly chaperone [Seongchinamella unica]TDG14979.1 pili assembly chaperone [Seongchinamella unica]
MLLGGLAVAIAHNGVLAAAQPITSSKNVTQVDRYSELTAGPTLEQRDLLAATVAVSIPNNIASLGGALRWILRDSGYRLAADSAIPPEIHSMLKLPLPAGHRRLGPMPLKEVLALMVGPEFHIVQDPVHRLVSFERCNTVQNSSQAQGEL